MGSPVQLCVCVMRMYDMRVYDVLVLGRYAGFWLAVAARHCLYMGALEGSHVTSTQEGKGCRSPRLSQPAQLLPTSQQDTVLEANCIVTKLMQSPVPKLCNDWT